MNAAAGAQDPGDQAEALRLDVVADGFGTIVRAAGEVDMATAPELQSCLMRLDGVVVVDLSEVPFLDSTGIAALIRAKKHLLDNDGDLHICHAQPQVRRVFEIADVFEWLNLS